MALDFLGIELKDWVAIIALLVSATVPSVLFLIGRIRGTRSEQFRFSLQIWDRIETQADIIYRGIRMDVSAREREGLSPQSALKSLNFELRFFIHLAFIGEIKDLNVRAYYADRLSSIRTIVEEAFPNSNPHVEDFLGLINTYYGMLVGKTYYSAYGRPPDD